MGALCCYHKRTNVAIRRERKLTDGKPISPCHDLAVLCLHLLYVCMKGRDSFERPSACWCPAHFNYGVREPLVKELSISVTFFSKTMLDESLTKTMQFSVVVVRYPCLPDSPFMQVEQSTHFFVLFWSWRTAYFSFCNDFFHYDYYWLITYDDLKL